MIEIDLNTVRHIFERALEQHIRYTMTPIELLQPMVYSLQNGGKRLRPTLLLSVLSIQSPDHIKLGLKSAMAVEYIHTYSLIHDDLPAMDNDELRRGKPTNHVQYGEATAILAGDALLTDAFDLIASDDLLDNRTKVRLMALLSKSAGSLGMVAGQLMDMTADNEAISLSQLQRLHALKTGELFKFCVEAGAVIGDVSELERQQLVAFSQHFGQAYQIHNDIMEVTATTEQTGKLNQSDLALDKATYPKFMGLEGAKEALRQELTSASHLLQNLTAQTGKPYEQLDAFLDYLR